MTTERTAQTMEGEFILSQDCYEALRRHLALGNAPLCGWPEIEAYCEAMRMQTRRGGPPKRPTLVKWGLPYTRQGLHAEAWTTTYLVISWYVQMVRPKAGHRPKADPEGDVRRHRLYDMGVTVNGTPTQGKRSSEQ